jgi:ubiquinone/menaquinone biosynthesis C-methylase UbiE
MKKYWEIFTDKFDKTILHPQFIMFSFIKENINEVIKLSKNKKLIDIGCGSMPYRKKIEPQVKKYVGVDHPKISKLYNPKILPEIYADITKKIPVKDSEFDIAIMLEVLEYLEKPEKTFLEIQRILKKEGILVLSTPFLYPLHDIPFDRNRFSKTQIKTFLNNSGFKIKKIKTNGGFIAFWLLSLNVFLMKRIMDILSSQKTFYSLLYLLCLLLITPEIIILSNLLFLLTKTLTPKFPNYFPLDYLAVAVKE